ncbi:phosphoserine phosphatase SerB [Acetobacteraceae bacterium]|nr:phosphoserine phosphatase SerB [Acetobacteraceae bacterium]
MSDPSAPRSFVLTVVANREEGNLSKEAIDTARHLVQGQSPVVLSEKEAVDISCCLPAENAISPETIRATLAPFRVDALLTRKRGRRKAVFTSDMDSTVLEGETPDAIIALRGRTAELKEIVTDARAKNATFAETMRRRIPLMANTTEEELQTILDGLKRADHIKEVVRTMKKNGALTALISGGFDWFTDRVAQEIGFDYAFANRLEWETGKLKGSLFEPVLGPENKAESLLQLCKERGVQTSAALAVGDGNNDIAMLSTAGLGVAWYADPKVKAVISTQINFTTMRTLLFAQGYPASEFVSE